jgi:hypothetical protein
MNRYRSVQLPFAHCSASRPVSLRPGRSLFLAASLFILMSLPQARADGNAPEAGGRWEGVFNYSSNDRPVNTHFSMYLASVTGQDDARHYAIEGTISEPRVDFGPDGQSLLSSTFTGSWNGAGVSFVKKYDYDGHSVEYNGDYNPGSESISGVWNIDGARGTFTLTGVKLVVSPEQVKKFQDQLGDTARRGSAVDAPVTNSATNRTAYNYAQVIDQFDVTGSPRYAVSSANDTYCNIFAWDVTRAMHAEIPHVLDGREIVINEAIDWLGSDAGGKVSGWHRIDARGAQELADSGHPAVATWENTDGGHGHIAVIRPGTVNDSRGDAIAEAGMVIKSATHVDTGFKKTDIRYWYHD